MIDGNQKVGKWFDLHEFLVSATAARAGRELTDIPDQYVLNIKRLCKLCFDPLRERLGRPIVLVSGYRPLWLNELVGGSRSSAHLEARAGDFIVPGMSLEDVCVAARELDLPYDQCILEFPPWGWIHMGIAKEGVPPRRQNLTALKVNGRTRYFVGHVLEAQS